ncbi:S1/P1 Nuclease [Reichenbachiella faecimaris]|uniref:S1/P1 Nuclease n=1 Tax=Reichenbachiella faecimaris TaxID=692418 RepID=A0A1W2GEQ3_REIFA|nr:S1/P1 nuclease [Reichenbachiella faecimaris]SMD34736.1 S1/P1 Nuclease [Reichenbachiella faecimaris]
MKKTLTFLLLTFITYSSAFSWGKTGHRVVGQIAYDHLTSKAKKNIQAILGDEHLGMVGNYMDFIRADRTKDFMTPWHYCTIPDGKTYQEAGVPEEGDAIQTINRLIKELTSKEFTYESEIENLKYLVHMVGDIHQPLHVGNGEDYGGNNVKVDFMWDKSYNLHRVWDSGLIDHQQLSYTEYVKWIDTATVAEIEKWQSEGIMIWVDEALSYRKAVYDIPENGKLRYDYNYTHIRTVNERLLKAGIRLAGILNEIYG